MPIPLLDILAEADKILEDPAWITFALTVLVGGLGLAVLFLVYPFGRDG
jgi:hypothetical protein